MPSLPFPVVTDDVVYAQFSYDRVVEAMQAAFAERAAGTLEAPPRWHVSAGDGDLVFTAGAATGRVNAAGFRIYETFPAAEHERTELVAVYDATNGAFDGLFVGHAIGGLRTGGIGGVAVDCLAREDATSLGVLGAGFQARSQVGAACAARSFDSVAVYSPTPERREAFAETVDGEVDPPVYPLEDPESVVSNADVLLCATNSREPVFDPDWLAPGTHVTTIGAKFADVHELPPAVLDRAAVIATDSLPQVEADHADRPSIFARTDADRDRLVELADVLDGAATGRTSDEDVTLFWSVGLAGTEVVLGSRLLDRIDATDR